jgi:hypothetical protein
MTMDLSPIVFGPWPEDADDRAVREMEEALLSGEEPLLITGVDYGYGDDQTVLITVRATTKHPIEYIHMKLVI